MMPGGSIIFPRSSKDIYTTYNCHWSASVNDSDMYFQMYEPASGPVKQTGAILQQAGAAAAGVLFQAPSSVAGPAQYVTMVTDSVVSGIMHRDTVDWFNVGLFHLSDCLVVFTDDISVRLRP